MKDHCYYFRHGFSVVYTEDIHNFINLVKFEDEYWVFF